MLPSQAGHGTGSAAPRTNQGKTTRVSVVVPNFNHARFLRRRLDSIYGQSFDDLEVILLDDCSTDDSVEILREYAAKNPHNTRLVVNEANTGSPFAQWAKGMEMARGPLVWIAESDDYCDTDFLALLLAPFDDPAVALAFTAPAYVDFEGRPIAFQFAEYTRELSLSKWQHSYIATAEQEVSEALGMRNTIPNVSAALFRRDAAVPSTRDPLWRRMKMRGDWCLYLKMLQGRKVAFVKEAVSYFTHTPENSCARLAREETYAVEFSAILSALRQCYPELPAETLDRTFAFFHAHLTWVFGDTPPAWVTEVRSVTLGERQALQHALAGAQSELASLRSDLKTLQQSLAESEQLVHRQAEKLAACAQSTSWRVTAPLRWVGESLRSFKPANRDRNKT
jgi:hypothetical protein